MGKEGGEGEALVLDREAEGGEFRFSLEEGFEQGKAGLILGPFTKG